MHPTRLNFLQNNPSDCNLHEVREMARILSQKGFIYIFEDGAVGQSDIPPTPMDMNAVDEGILEVIDLTNMKIITQEGPIEIPKSVMLTDPFSGHTFHADHFYEET
jgi:hypothetical protein